MDRETVLASLSPIKIKLREIQRIKPKKKYEKMCSRNLKSICGLRKKIKKLIPVVKERD